MNFQKIALSLAVSLSAYHFAAAQTPNPAQNQIQPIVIVGGTLHIGNGSILDNAAVRFENGKITAIGKADEVNRQNAEIVDAQGKHIYPGMILCNSTVGLGEIDAVRASIDHSETGEMNPNVRALVAYNAENQLAPTIRDNGVMLAQIAPRSGTLSGTSSVVEFDAWNWEDAGYKADEGIYLDYPSGYEYSYFRGTFEENTQQSEAVKKLATFFDEAVAYTQNPTPSPTNLKFEAMKGLFDGSKTLYIRSEWGKDIISSVQLAQKYKVKKIVIVGGSDAWMVTDFLKENKVPVIIDLIFSLPTRTDDDIDRPFRLPAILQQAGVEYCISFSGYRAENMNARNLAFAAGMAVGYGLEKEQALQAISLNVAKILGIDKTVGSVEVGKDATILVSEGDVLDMRSNKIITAFIRGKKLDMSNHQKDLHQKYSQKYGIKE